MTNQRDTYMITKTNISAREGLRHTFPNLSLRTPACYTMSDLPTRLNLEGPNSEWSEDSGTLAWCTPPGYDPAGFHLEELKDYRPGGFPPYI